LKAKKPKIKPTLEETHMVFDKQRDGQPRLRVPDVKTNAQRQLTIFCSLKKVQPCLASLGKIINAKT
jgi:hypothetical protein